MTGTTSNQETASDEWSRDPDVLCRIISAEIAMEAKRRG